MDKFYKILEKYLLPPMTKLSEQRHMRAIRDGIISTIPIIIVGCAFLIIASPPIPALAEAVKPYAGKILYPFRLTMGIMSLYASYGIGTSLAKSYKLDQLEGGMLAASAFLLTSIPLSLEETGWVLPIANIGGSGLFVAIIMSIFAVEVFRFAKEKNITIKMPEQVPESVANSFAALVPAAIIIFTVWVIRDLLNFDIQSFVMGIFKPLVVAGNTLPGILVPIVLITLLWACGIHGDSIVGSVARPIWLTLLDQNVAAQAAGKAIPNIAPEPFFQWFVWIGGSGTTIALVVLMLRARSKYLRDIAKVSLIPGICNINEPIIFGAPIMLNPIFLIPFIVAPVIEGIIAYFAMYFNLVSRPFILAPWTLPGPIGAYFATGGDIRAALLVIINFIIATIIYYPFFKAYDKKMCAQESGEEICVEKAGQAEAK